MKSNQNLSKKIWLGLLVAIASVFLMSSGAWAFSPYLTSFNDTYNTTYKTSGSKLNACILCHTSPSGGARNSYGSDFANSSVGNHTFNATLANRDSDGDGFTNLAEIAALTFPGNAADRPVVVPVPDTTAPVVTGFTIPATSSSLTVSITTFTATDAVGVTGYQVTESSTPPGATGWVTPRPASFTFTTAGAKTLYAWAKDLAGNVSASRSATVTITLPPPPAPDTTAPVVTAFTIPATSSSLTVSITTFTATDAVGVTGYQVTESSTAPASGAAGWVTPRPASFTFTTAGAKTLYAWAKDLAGNVSASRSAAVTITLPVPPTPDTMAPVVTAFTIPATSSSLTVSITTLTATDAVGVTGYQVTESATPPGATGWVNPRPASYRASSAGTKKLYSWARDAAGNVSASLSGDVTITLPSTPPPSSGDTQAPVVTAFQLENPLTWTGIQSQRTVNITAFTATDNVEVTGYLITTRKKKPSASSPAWSASPPETYTFPTPGRKTLYAWAKDAAGNVSAGRKATIKVSGVPIIPLPTGQQSFIYDASELSVQSASPASNQPMGVNVSDGVMTIQVHVGPFAGKVDAYVALQGPAGVDGSPGPMVSLNHDGEFVYIDDESDDDSEPEVAGETEDGDDDGEDSISPWLVRKTVVNGFVFNNDPVTDLEPGHYTIILTVTPAGRPDLYYQWTTTFDVP